MNLDDLLTKFAETSDVTKEQQNEPIPSYIFDEFEGNTSDQNDSKQMSELDKLVQRFKDIDSSAIVDHSDCVDLFASSDIYRNSDCTETLIQCGSLNRICKVLIEYNIFMEQNQSLSSNENVDIHEAIYNKIENDYNNIQLLNDFNHLMHSHSAQFEDIFNILSQQIYHNNTSCDPCDVSGCLFMRRNHRDRMKMSQNTNMLNDLYFTKDDNQMIVQQLIDRVHCHFFHTFDIGYKISRKDRERVVNQDIKQDDDEKADHLRNRFVSSVSKLIRCKKDKHRNTEGLERIYANNNSKFVTTEYSGKDKVKPNKLNEYRFGFRFFYHEYYKDNERYDDPAAVFSDMTFVVKHPSNDGYSVGEMYIEPKSVNLKQELVHNIICCISASDWNNLYQRAMDYIQTNNAKRLKCPRTKSAEYYNDQYDTMVHNKGITLDHLISAMIYCNFDLLQSKFSATYRRTTDEESVEKIKERHRNYYWLGRRLRECVECFGMKHNPKSIDIRIWHGVNQMLEFESLFAYVKGPFSTTQDFAIAVNFSDQKGLVLELKMDVKSWIFKMIEGSAAAETMACFDMTWLSDYSNEAEIFFVGGLNRFYFHSIKEASIGKDYEFYILGIKQMTSGMTHGGISADTLDANVPRNLSEQQMVYRLMAHRFYETIPDHKHAIEFKLCPKYIKELLRRHCGYIKYISFFETDKKHKVLDHFFKDDNGWIKLNDLTKIFPNLNHFKYYAHNEGLEFIQNHQLYQSILDYIDGNIEIGNYHYNLTKINLSIDVHFEDIMKEFMQKHYKEEFAKRGWVVHVYYVDPVKKWGETTGIDIGGYFKAAKQGKLDDGGNFKQMVEVFTGNGTITTVLGILAKDAGLQEDFRIWDHYDKLGQVILWMAKKSNQNITIHINDDAPDVD